MKVLVLLSALVAVSCSRPVKLKGVKAAKTEVEATVTTISSGTVHAKQQAVLGFGTTGRVARILVSAGDRVKEGQELAALENRDLEAIEGEARKEYLRNQKLFKENLVSRVALEESRRAMEVAKANLTRSVILATFDGMVTEVNLELGETVSVGGRTPLRLVDLGARIIKGDIDEVDLARVKEGQKARIRIPAVGQNPFVATVTKVVPYIDTSKEQDRTSQIELQLEETEARVPVGASAEVEIVTERKGEAVAVPTRTVLGGLESRYVFKEVGGRLQKTSVKLGIGNYERVEVLEGLAEGDTVVFPSEERELADGLKASVELQTWP